jgi:hypothetical protein
MPALLYLYLFSQELAFCPPACARTKPAPMASTDSGDGVAVKELFPGPTTQQTRGLGVSTAQVFRMARQ